jgi:nucleoside-diphosphate-sugar epimerase
MQILITGGAGKLGAMVVETLVQRGHHVHVFDLPHVDFSPVNTLPRVHVFKGTILDRDHIAAACEGIDVAVHLAAILPPYSEQDAETTLRVNATGTSNVVQALEGTSAAPLVLSSSVSVYGSTQDATPPITTRHPRAPTDTYAQSKILAEDAVRNSSLRHTILRISGIYAAVPFEFPSPVQFRATQRVEFVAREDVVTALVAAAENTSKGHTILNIAGGRSWQMTGERFVGAVFAAFGVDGAVDYPHDDGYFDWYDTHASQRRFRYQQTSFACFTKKLSTLFNT